MKKITDKQLEFVLFIISIIVAIIVLLGSCKKKELEVLPIPIECEKEEQPPYEFQEQDLYGTWQASKIILDGRIISRFNPEQNIVIMDEETIGIYFNDYYTTPTPSSYVVTEDSISLEKDAFAYKYTHDSLLELRGMSKYNQTIQFTLTR